MVGVVGVVACGACRPQPLPRVPPAGLPALLPARLPCPPPLPTGLPTAGARRRRDCLQATGFTLPDLAVAMAQRGAVRLRETPAAGMLITDLL